MAAGSYHRGGEGKKQHMGAGDSLGCHEPAACPQHPPTAQQCLPRVPAPPPQKPCEQCSSLSRHALTQGPVTDGTEVFVDQQAPGESRSLARN